VLPHFVAPQGDHDPCLRKLGLFPHKHPKGICPEGKNPRGQKPHLSLHRDLFADSAAQLRRRIRRRQHRLAALGSLSALAVIAALTLQPDPRPDLSSAIPTPALPAKPAALYETLTTDEERLADQGPMLIIHSDGRRQLLLTRPR
jgi:hypothetical protein